MVIQIVNLSSSNFIECTLTYFKILGITIRHLMSLLPLETPSPLTILPCHKPFSLTSSPDTAYSHLPY